ncbi:hypothetical protein Nepgr_030996 [Nepenthes gracilis]|uniref:Uncharacterized protein n=1 Tax=Nepenthes gracilis TaxID=150966 RepID=A0AAD3THM0_NEPGR|nr:hypothetical protein Nepgr_030996 [Nepenthes gracilis]
MGTKGLPGSDGILAIESSDSWKDDCVGTMSSSRSLPASTYLECTKTILRQGTLGASVGTKLSSTIAGNGKDRTSMKCGSTEEQVYGREEATCHCKVNS